MLDAEHILGILLLLAPSESPTYLGNEADIIAETAATEREAAGAVALVVVPSGNPWGAHSDPICRRDLSAESCAQTFVERWREGAAVCGVNIERRFSYWNTGTCTSLGGLTRRQMRVYRAAMREL